MDSVEQIRSKAQRLLMRTLTDSVRCEIVFPISLRYSASIAKNAKPSEVYEWVESLKKNSKSKLEFSYTLTLKVRNSRDLGRIQFPKEIMFASWDDLVEFTEFGRGTFMDWSYRLSELGRISENLLTWVEKSPMGLIELTEANWQYLLITCRYFLKTPLPGVHARELPIPVPTKYIERNRSLLGRLLPMVVGDQFNPEGLTLEERHGLKESISLIEVRLLDTYSEFPLRHFSIRAEELSNIQSQFDKILILENRRNFLAVESHSRTLAILGGGYGVGLLRQASIPESCRIYYWGDIDPHGYRILSNLRLFIPRVQSLLMDEDLGLWDYAQEGARVGETHLPGLTKEEGVLFQKVEREGISIEQEKIPQEIWTAELKSKLE